jgi:uncharacterized membrane protein YfcA
VTEPIDTRKLRFGHSVVAIALLAGFVFRAPWVVPVVAVILAVPIAFGPRADPLHQLYDAVLAPRLAPSHHTDDPALARIASLIVVLVLTLATAAFALDVDSIGWLLALVVAASSAIAATIGVDPVRVGLARLRRRG